MADFHENDCPNSNSKDNWLVESPFRVRKILDERQDKNGKSYKVCWEDSWVPLDALNDCQDLIDQFNAQKKTLVEIIPCELPASNKDESLTFLVRIPQQSFATSTYTNIDGLEGKSLIDKFKEIADKENAQPIRVSPYQYNKSDVDATTAATTVPLNENNDTEDKLSQKRRRSKGDGNKILYKCESCELEFVHRTHLDIHQRTHTGEKPFSCEVCGRGFAQKGNLHVHMKIHTGQKEYECQYCNKRFITNAQLFVHLKTHTNPKRKSKSKVLKKDHMKLEHDPHHPSSNESDLCRTIAHVSENQPFSFEQTPTLCNTPTQWDHGNVLNSAARTFGATVGKSNMDSHAISSLQDDIAFHSNDEIIHILIPNSK